MLKLITGLHHFQSEVFSSHKELFERLVDGQSPEALFITCADSRINPNLITQTSPGDLFILRNAGNIVPPHGAANGGEAATVEFAIRGLGVKNIIICGHSHCGAMRALLHPEELVEMPALKDWLSFAEATRRTVEENYSGFDDAQLLNIAVQENVLTQLENLRTHPAVQARLSSGQLNLHGWTYKIESGEVFNYQSDAGQFLPVNDVPLTAERRRPRLGLSNQI